MLLAPVQEAECRLPLRFVIACRYAVRMPHSGLLAGLADELRTLATPERARNEKAYLKSDLEHLGVRVPDVRRVTLKLTRVHLPRELGPTLAFADELWAPKVHELRMAAVELLIDRADLLNEGHLPYLERLVREARTWALIDGIAPGIVGRLLVRDEAVESTLISWAADADFWVRRAAVLAYLRAVPSGSVAFARFAALADPLLEDKEFFVRKALGWVLREHGKKAPAEVFAWLWPRRQRAARLTLREAAKFLSEEQRLNLLADPGSSGLR